MASKKQIVIDNKDKIEEWLSQGVTVENIAKVLGISKQTLYKYFKADDINAIKNARQPAVEKLENTMYRTATGYSKIIKKYAKVKRCRYNEVGKKQEEWEEMIPYEEEIYFPPDTTAGIFLLKNWGNYMNEPRAMEIRKKEVELREKQVNATVW